MRTKRNIAGANWEFDGTTITVRMPMAWKRRGGRKVIIAPDGGEAWAPAKPRPDERLIRALARAHRWRRLIEDGDLQIGGRDRRSGGRHSELRQPAAAAHAALAGYSAGNYRRRTAEGDAIGGGHPGDPGRVGGTTRDYQLNPAQ